ncbi:TPA: hypothetical protein ACH1J3_004117 [Citrobacter werkmanii]
MSIIKCIAKLLFVFFLFNMNVMAGSPGGLWLVVMPLDNAVIYKQSVNAFLKKNMGVDKYISCDGYMVSADVFYITRHPPKITTMLIEQALSDNTGLHLLKKYLREYRDDLVTSDDGFNGLLTYKIMGKDLQFYGVQSWSGGKDSDEIYKSSLNASELNNEQKLSNAICLALKGIPVSAP